jgi:hypothetical protein
MQIATRRGFCGAQGVPWKCRRLVVGTGAGALSVMKEVKAEAQRRKIKLMILPTAEAIEILKKAEPAETHAILHVTC